MSMPHSYILHFECFMQESIHLMNDCHNSQRHEAIYTEEGSYAGIVCQEHLAYSRDVLSPPTDTYAPFFLLKQPNYTR